MSVALNRARMTTSTTGTGTVTLGSATVGHATFAEAGAVDATQYSYCIEDGNDFEIGYGTYTSSGTTFSRDTVVLSKISGTAGTSKINLSGSAEIFITALGEDIAPANVGQGQHTIWLPAQAWIPATTNGCASLAIFEYPTNKTLLPYLSFDATTEESAQAVVQLPKSWNEGTIVAQVVWKHGATATNFGVTWKLSAIALGDGDAYDAAFGTAVSITDTGGSDANIYRSPESSGMTVGGSPAAEEFVIFKIARDPTDGSDTLAVDAEFLGLKLHITTDAATDD